MRLVPPPWRKWKDQVPSEQVIAVALLNSRPGVLTATRRLDGLPDAEVLDRRAPLWAAVRARAADDPRVLATLVAREADDLSGSRLATAVTVSGAADDPAVVDLALHVWEALGRNAFGLAFTPPRRTYLGFLEGRAWLIAGTAPPVALVLVGFVQDLPWAPLLLAGAVAWAWGARRLYRWSVARREGVAGKGLPWFS